MNESITEKACTTCKNTKPISEFYRQKSSRDGFYPACKECANKRYRQYYLDHAEELKEHTRKYNSENREASRESARKYREENPEKAKLSKEKYRLSAKGILKEQEYKRKNAEKNRESSRRYYWKHPGRLQSYRGKNPEKTLAWKRNRSARIRGNGGEITFEEWQNILEKYDNTCLCCKRKGIKLTMDHVVPLKLGGEHAASNVQPICQSCNSRKHVKVIDYR